jgi:tetratricopeptide (TPR) repeat protein
MSTSLVAVGFLEEVGPRLQDAVRLARETGDLSVSWVALGGLGYWYAQKGDTDMATECLDEALGMAADLGSYLTVPLLQAYRGEVDIALGNFEAAADRTRAAAQLGKDTRQQTFEAEARRVLAWALAYQSQRDEALAEFAEALDLHHKTGARVLECRSLFQLAELLRSIGEEAHADDREAAAAAIARDCGLHWLPGPVPRPRAPRAPVSDGT